MPPPTCERFREEEEAAETHLRRQQATRSCAACHAMPGNMDRLMPRSVSSRSLSDRNSASVVRYMQCRAYRSAAAWNARAAVARARSITLSVRVSM